MEKKYKNLYKFEDLDLNNSYINHLSEEFYLDPRNAKMILTDKQLEETLKTTNGKIFSGNIIWEIKSIKIGEEKNLVCLHKKIKHHDIIYRGESPWTKTYQDFIKEKSGR